MNELVYLKNDEAVCDSLQIAEKFGKEHKNVLQSIDNLIAENSAVKIMFKISSYKSGNGQSYRKFYMNRDGFSLLAMGFTGKEALEWKLQYIKAFNQMEKLIREKGTAAYRISDQEERMTRRTETDTIKEFVEYAKEQGSTHADHYYSNCTRLAYKTVGITDKATAAGSQLDDLSLVEHLIAHTLRTGMAAGRGYKDIYLDCKHRLESMKYLQCTA